MLYSQQVPIFFHPAQLEFHPLYEWALGKRIKHPETTRRAETIFQALKREPKKFSIVTPPKIPLKAIRESHNYQLITLYNTAAHLPEGEAFYPSVFPQRSKAKPDPNNIKHAGFFCFDSGTPLNNKVWTAAAWSAASAYFTADCILKSQANFAYALSRPPGHHASRDAYGGYCYFNNGVIAAKLLRKKGRVVVLDIDFHHGNGTQEAFYHDDKVLTISLHGDPRSHFPYFTGYQYETGVGKGAGFNVNLILKDGTEINEYVKVLKKTVFPIIKRFEPTYLIVSVGFDTYVSDPIGSFALQTSDYHAIGSLIANLNYPTAILQEGGYNAKDIGKNAVSFLSGFHDCL